MEQTFTPTVTGPTTSVRKSEKAINMVLWILQILLAVMFAFTAGLPKLMGAPEQVAIFDAIGVGHWFRYLTGALEISGALLLLIPALSGLGALVLATVMIGAVATHLFVLGEGVIVPTILLAMVMIVAWGRRKRLQSFVNRR